jgi:hypothetical protein
MHGLLELFFVEGSRSVIICNLELLANTLDTSGTSSSNSLSDMFDQSFIITSTELGIFFL